MNTSNSAHGARSVNGEIDGEPAAEAHLLDFQVSAGQADFFRQRDVLLAAKHLALQLVRLVGALGNERNRLCVETARHDGITLGEDFFDAEFRFVRRYVPFGNAVADNVIVKHILHGSRKVSGERGAAPAGPAQRGH